MPSDAAIKQAAGRLRSAMVWAKANLPEYESIVPAKKQVLARYQPVFSPANIPELTEEEFRSFLLFENNKHWPLHRQGRQICADMDLLREALAILVDAHRPIEERLNALLPPSDGSMVPYLGRAVITGILLVVEPDRYGVWNTRSEASLKRLGIFPDVDSRAPFAQRYVAFNEVLTQLAAELDVDLWTLDFLHYAFERQQELAPETDVEQEPPELACEPEADVRFGLERHLHDFLRDNWDNLSLGQEWALHEEDGEVVGYEYTAGLIGSIDLLAHHRTEPRWLVVELKRNQTSDTTVGQVLRYMGWVAENLATN